MTRKKTALPVPDGRGEGRMRQDGGSCRGLGRKTLRASGRWSAYSPGARRADSSSQICSGWKRGVVGQSKARSTTWRIWSNHQLARWRRRSRRTTRGQRFGPARPSSICFMFVISNLSFNVALSLTEGVGQGVSKQKNYFWAENKGKMRENGIPPSPYPPRRGRSLIPRLRELPLGSVLGMRRVTILKATPGCHAIQRE